MAEPATFVIVYFASREDARQAAESPWPGLDLFHRELPVQGTTRLFVAWQVTGSNDAMPDSWLREHARRLAEPIAAIGAVGLVVVQGDEHHSVPGIGG